MREAACQVCLYSLGMHTVRRTYRFRTPVAAIESNRYVLAISLAEYVYLFDAMTLEPRFRVANCYPPVPGEGCANPIALGERWIAYPANSHPSRAHTCPDMRRFEQPTLLTQVKETAVGWTAAITQLGHRTARLWHTVMPSNNRPPASAAADVGADPSTAAVGASTGEAGADATVESLYDGAGGLVTVCGVDGTETTGHAIRTPVTGPWWNAHWAKPQSSDACPERGRPAVVASPARMTVDYAGTVAIRDVQTGRMMAHFVAMQHAVSALAFDASGTLLITASVHGHGFNVFRIEPTPVASQPTCGACRVRHLYQLHRGITGARIQGMAFSPDSRWVVLATGRGTSHVFPILPRGGDVVPATHLAPTVTNAPCTGYRDFDERQLSTVRHVHAVLRIKRLPLASVTTRTAVPPASTPTPAPAPPTVHLRALLQSSLAAMLNRVPAMRTTATAEPTSRAAVPVAVCFLPPAKVEAITRLLLAGPNASVTTYALTPCAGTVVATTATAPSAPPLDLREHALRELPLGRMSTSPEFAEAARGRVHSAESGASGTAGGAGRNVAESAGASWLAQVEIKTHLVYRRPIWMGPQFVFKVFQPPVSPSGVPSIGNLSEPGGGVYREVQLLSDTECGSGRSRTESTASASSATAQTVCPVFDDEATQLPQQDLMHGRPAWPGGADRAALRQDLADAMVQPISHSACAAGSATGCLPRAGNGADTEHRGGSDERDGYAAASVGAVLNAAGADAVRDRHQRERSNSYSSSDSGSYDT